jgi:hypothetical protein
MLELDIGKIKQAGDLIKYQGCFLPQQNVG